MEILITRKDVLKLTREPLGFAMMMQNQELEDIIVTFVSVLNKRKINGGDYNKRTHIKPDSHKYISVMP